MPERANQGSPATPTSDQSGPNSEVLMTLTDPEKDLQNLEKRYPHDHSFMIRDTHRAGLGS